MTSPDIPDDEIRRMVAPLTQPAAIRRWFVKQGFTVRQKPNGMPLISRAHFEAHMSAGRDPGGAIEATPSNTPDLTGFLARYDKGVGYGPHGKKANKQPPGSRP